MLDPPNAPFCETNLNLYKNVEREDGVGIPVVPGQEAVEDEDGDEDEESSSSSSSEEEGDLQGPAPAPKDYHKKRAKEEIAKLTPKYTVVGGGDQYLEITPHIREVVQKARWAHGGQWLECIGQEALQMVQELGGERCVLVHFAGETHPKETHYSQLKKALGDLHGEEKLKFVEGTDFELVKPFPMVSGKVFPKPKAPAGVVKGGEVAVNLWNKEQKWAFTTKNVAPGVPATGHLSILIKCRAKEVADALLEMTMASSKGKKVLIYFTSAVIKAPPMLASRLKGVHSEEEGGPSDAILKEAIKKAFEGMKVEEGDPTLTRLTEGGVDMFIKVKPTLDWNALPKTCSWTSTNGKEMYAFHAAGFCRVCIAWGHMQENCPILRIWGIFRPYNVKTAS